MKKQIIFLLILSANFASAQQSRAFKNWANSFVNQINELYNKPVENNDSPITLDISKALFSKKHVNITDLKNNIVKSILYHKSAFVHADDAKKAVIDAWKEIKKQAETCEKAINEKILQGLSLNKNKEYENEKRIIKKSIQDIFEKFFIPLKNELRAMSEAVNEQDRKVTFDKYKKIICNAVKKYCEEDKDSIFKLEEDSFKVILKNNF